MAVGRFATLPAPCRRYVISVAAIGLTIAGYSLAQLLRNPVSREWFVLAALTLLTGSFTVRIPGLKARLSVSESFVFASVLMYGPAAGTVTAILDVLIISLRLRHFRGGPVHVIFNAAEVALSTWVAGHFFFAASGVPPYSVQHTELAYVLLPLAGFTAIYFLLNSWLVTIALALERNERPTPIWKANFLWLSLNYFGSASVAALLVAYTPIVDITALSVIVPLLVITYLTFRTSLGRLEDAQKHVDEVNRLYLSTIETLAMAIDAKDQVTHGHIRRVQQFTLGLAAELGVKDKTQLKALEAAALLHDTGKLVVPEHILNKPGRLTPGEFEKMKLHAPAGAEILSAIQFPYPVVPIVRYHHENWDGTGYPEGLKGTAIPLGSRILQVVDCYDALTSDRPYRRRLTDVDAVAVLMQRRGTMYDPLVVDTFIAARHRLESAFKKSDSIAASAIKTRATSAPHHVETVERIAVGEARYPALVQQITGMLASLQKATGAQLGILFVTDDSRDEIVGAFSSPPRTSVADVFVMAIGSRVSGWVAANGKSILNADASLDLIENVGGLSRCLCVPLNKGQETVGVLSLYLGDARGFSEHDMRLVEASIANVDLAVLEKFVAVLSGRQNPPKTGAAPLRIVQ